jgi:predicted acetyltransferase
LIVSPNTAAGGGPQRRDHAQCQLTSLKRVSSDDLPRAGSAPGGLTVRPVADDQWQIVAWLWQLFRHDLAPIVSGLPYADGRYQAAQLAQYPSPNGAGYLAWRPHPKTGADAPVGFAVVDGLLGERRSVVGFWVAPVLRREGVGRLLAIDVLTRPPGPWSVGFQDENVAAGTFWRAVADDVFGQGRWSEARRPVPGLPGVPPDHFIESS